MFLLGWISLRLVADLVPWRPVGWFVAGAAAAVLFSAGHAYQGITGMVDTFLLAMVMAALYFGSGRNLWLPVITHGVYNTVAFVLIFLGLHP